MHAMDTLRHTLPGLQEAMRTAHAMLMSEPRDFDEDDYADVLDVLTHFAKVPGFEEGYGWLAGLHVTSEEREEVRRLAGGIAEQWDAARV